MTCTHVSLTKGYFRQLLQHGPCQECHIHGVTLFKLSFDLETRLPFLCNFSGTRVCVENHVPEPFCSPFPKTRLVKLTSLTTLTSTPTLVLTSTYDTWIAAGSASLYDTHSLEHPDLQRNITQRTYLLPRSAQTSCKSDPVDPLLSRPNNQFTLYSQKCSSPLSFPFSFP